jgi:hypothetical protein
VNYLASLIRLDNLRMNFLLLLILFIPKAYSVECQWWQIKVSASDVDKHPRQQTTVRQHPRAGHCRNKWKDADIHIKQFSDKPIIGWSHKGEVFKKWTRDEIQIILEILPTLPAWTEIPNYNFRRAKDSKYKGNPATSELINKSIILYDQFFKEKNKKSIIVHESSHHIYKKLGPDGVKEFVDLSGWKLEVDKAGKVYEIPPKVLIKPDSSVSKEEDFSNHVEEFYTSPETYAKKYPEIHQFLKGRLK